VLGACGAGAVLAWESRGEVVDFEAVLPRSAAANDGVDGSGGNDAMRWRLRAQLKLPAPGEARCLAATLWRERRIAEAAWDIAEEDRNRDGQTVLKLCGKSFVDDDTEAPAADGGAVLDCGGYVTLRLAEDGALMLAAAGDGGTLRLGVDAETLALECVEAVAG